MTTDEDVQSSNACRANGDFESHKRIVNDGTSTVMPSEPSLPRSRFFRTKRKQRLGENAINTNGDIHTNPTNTVVRSKTRSLSPPAQSLDDDDDDSDDNDDDISSVQTVAVKKVLLAEAKKSHTNMNSGTVLKKSQSVKLTRVDHHDTNEKKVCFADDCGLKLSQVKVIKTDELPSVPVAAFRDLHIDTGENSQKSSNQEKTKLIVYMEPQFEHPLYIPDFADRLSNFKVVLEQANAIDNRIYGTIRLTSFGIHKRVRVRLTTDNWITFKDHDASYIVNSFDGVHDRFSFVVDVSRSRICAGNNIQFCIWYEPYVTRDYWDNNYGQNYRFDCCTRAIPDYTI